MVIYPNVDVENFQIGQQDGDFTSPRRALFRTSRFLLIVNAFELMPSRKLVVIGAGPLLNEVLRPRLRMSRFSGINPMMFFAITLCAPVLSFSRQKRISELLLWKRKPVGRRSSHLDGVELPRR